jgi:hypothetical protein
MVEIEIENGILGVKRDILMSFVDLMIFREKTTTQISLLVSSSPSTNNNNNKQKQQTTST